MSGGSRERKLKIWGSRRRRECHWCGVRLTFDEATVDHRVPRAKGGTDASENLVIACVPCNTEKADKMPLEYALQK